MSKYYQYVFLLLLFVFQGCLELETIEDVQNSPSYAIPLVNSSLSIADLLQNVDDNTKVKINNDGKVTVFYEGDLLSITAPEVFPAIPIFSAIPITDTSSFIVSDFVLDFETRLLNFKNTDIAFRFQSQFDEPVSVEIHFPEIQKDGVHFSQNFQLDETGEVFQSPDFSWHEWALHGDLTSIKVIYDARLMDGTRVKLETVEVVLKILAFSYSELSLNNELFDLAGEIIDIEVYNGYQSGGLFFDDPRLNLIMDYSFGFPAIAKVNKFEITNTEGENIDLIGTLIEDGFQVNRPDTVGQSKITSFLLSNENSNIAEIFNERTVAVSYDVDVLSFPGEEVKFGWVTDSSYVNLKVAVELPILLSADNLSISDTFDINGDDFQEIQQGELKIVIDNELPIDANIELLFIDSTGQELLALIAEDDFNIPSAILNADLSTESRGEQVFFVTLDAEEMNLIRQKTQLAIRTNISTKSVSDQSVWLLDNYDMNIRIGLKATIDEL